VLQLSRDRPTVAPSVAIDVADYRCRHETRYRPHRGSLLVWLLQLSYPQTNTFHSRNHLCSFVSLHPVYFRNNSAGIYANHGRLLINYLQLAV